MNNMNGWQRLWVVTVLLYGIFITVIAINEAPQTAREIETAWIFNATEIIAARSNDVDDTTSFRKGLYKHKSHEEIIAWLEGVAKSPSEKSKSFSSELSALNAKYKARLANVPERQRRYIIVAFIAWLLPSIGLYILGWLVAWVIRGFKKE